MKTLIPALVLGLFCLTAQAETLADIYELAKRNDPVIREAEANMLAQMQAKPQARATWLPQIGFSGNLSYGENEGSRTFGSVEIQNDNEAITRNWQFQVTQTLLNTEAWNQLKQADSQVAQSIVDYQAAQQELMVRVAEAYFEVLAAQDQLGSERANKDAIERQLEQAERRFEVGLIAITDVKESQAAFDDAVALEIAAQRALATAKEGLREVTGEYPQKLANPGEEFPLIAPEPQVEQDWVDISMQQNLTLESAKINTEITRQNIKIARGGYWPTLDLDASYGEFNQDFTDNTTNPPTNSDPESSSTQVGINLNFPIFQGGGVKARVQEEVYRHRAARESYEGAVRATERETRDAYLGVIAEIARVQALARSVESNKVALEATEAGYEVGTRTTVEVLNQRRSLFLAETQYARSKYDYLINVLRLKRAAGTLTEEDVALINSWLVRDEPLPETPGRGAQPDAEIAPRILDQKTGETKDISSTSELMEPDATQPPETDTE